MRPLLSIILVIMESLLELLELIQHFFLDLNLVRKILPFNLGSLNSTKGQHLLY